MDNYNKKFGAFGEDLAVKYLIGKGYRIIDRNVQAGHKEIDIIAKLENKFVFVEVKTRSSESCDCPEYSVYGKKTQHLKRAIKIYLGKNGLLNSSFRLDLLVIMINKIDKIASVKHYEDIF